MHVDDYIDDYDGDAYARWVLHHFRLPANLQNAFAPFMREHHLYCTHANKRWRVIGASRMGDVWLTTDFSRDHGYDLRVLVTECSGWSSEP